MALTLRPATLADVTTLERWDTDPDVIASGDDPDGETAFDGSYWPTEIDAQSDVYSYFIAELDGRPIGAMLIIDPHLEPTHYWGDCAPNLRAVDIWIGDAADRGRGHGAEIMRLALARCFADLAVAAVLIDPLARNVRAHRFYERLGFAFVERRRFGDDHCLVYQLTRQDWRHGA